MDAEEGTASEATFSPRILKFSTSSTRRTYRGTLGCPKDPGSVASLTLSDAEIGDFVQVEGASIFDVGLVGEMPR